MDEHPDALTIGRARGRGAGLNPANRFDSDGRLRLHVLGDHLDRVADDHPTGVQVGTTTVSDVTRNVINRVDSPDLPFHWTINPYRGCEHGCIYCYARPTHELLGLSCGLDFETKIVAKPDAPALLRRELAAPSWKGEPIAMSGVTDAYQPLERRLRITRGCLEVMAECRQPVTIVTKGRLVLRDVDLLGELARHHAARVAVSITTLDPELARCMEPRASSPRDRLRTIEGLRDAGIPVMVMVAPVIPGLTDHEMPTILQAAHDHGAQAAAWVLLRLPYQVKELFREWLDRERPARADRIENAVRGSRDGKLYDASFGVRARGVGARAEQIGRTFEVFTRRAGLRAELPPLSSAAFRRPAGADGQLELWGAPGRVE